jgi:hypothetical protein
MSEKVLTTSTIILGLTMGVLTIVYTIWNRLIRVRLPREIEGELWTLQFWIILYLFIIFFIMFIYDCNTLQKKLRVNPNSNGLILRLITRVNKQLSKYPKLLSFLEDILQIFKNYILGGPLFLWKYYYFHNRRNKLIFYLYDIGVRIWGLYLHQRCKNFRLRVVLTTIILGYLPRIIAVSMFLYEIVIEKKLEYFYSIAMIFLIPLIFNSYKRILFDICYSERIDFEKDIELIGVKGNYPDDSYMIANRNPNIIPEQKFKPYGGEFTTLLKIQRVIVEFFKIDEAYGYIVKLIVNGILMLSFLFWVFAIIQP